MFTSYGDVILLVEFMAVMIKIFLFSIKKLYQSSRFFNATSKCHGVLQGEVFVPYSFIQP